MTGLHHLPFAFCAESMASLKIIPLAVLFVVGVSYARTPSYILNELTPIGRKAHDSGKCIDVIKTLLFLCLDRNEQKKFEYIHH